MIYLGSLGRMIGVGCASEQRSLTGDRYAFQTTLEGRVVAQARPMMRRSWDMRLSRVSQPHETALLTDFTSGAWGDGPFRFIPTEAPITNLLPPGVAACEPEEQPAGTIVDGGPMRQPDGAWAPRSYASTDPSQFIFFGRRDHTDLRNGHAVPVTPGQWVTGAVTVTGDGARADLRFYDAMDQQLHLVVSDVTATDGRPVRSMVSAKAPAGAVCARLFGRNSLQASRPQVTWTDGPVDWSEGRGCRRSVVLGGDQELIRTGHQADDRTYEGVSFTVQEVG